MTRLLSDVSSRDSGAGQKPSQHLGVFHSVFYPQLWTKEKWGPQVFDVVQVRSGARVVTDPSRDARLTVFGKATLSDRYLLPGESYQDMFARVASAYADDDAPCPAALRLHQQSLVHAGHAGAEQRRHQARPADLLLPERGQRLARRHRRPVERECLAGRARRRHRLLLGQPALDRREGRHERQDLRRRAVHPRHGFADARRSARARCAAARPRSTCRSAIPRSRSSSRSAARPAAIPTARR